MKITKRKAITTGGTALLAPSFVGIVSGATDSGEIEIATDSTIPTDTGIAVRLNEYQNGTVENTQTVDLSGGSGEVNEFAALEGSEGSGYSYELEITLTTTDDATTPELSSATVTLPERQEPTEEPTETETDPQGLEGIIDNYLLFVTTSIIAVSGLAAAGTRSMAVGALAGYSVFAYIAIQTGEQILENILIVTLVLIFIGFAFKFWRLEGMGE
jgi:hypothetical protein